MNKRKLELFVQSFWQRETPLHRRKQAFYGFESTMAGLSLTLFASRIVENSYKTSNHSFFQDLSGIRIFGILLVNLVDFIWCVNITRKYILTTLELKCCEPCWTFVKVRGFFSVTALWNLPRLGSDVFCRSDCNEQFWAIIDFEIQIELPKSYFWSTFISSKFGRMRKFV